MKSKKASIRDCMDKMLELLIVIDSTCKELGIKYWIDGGTLLGSVRHGGYIPWDDDVDICLLTDDFHVLTARLSEICENHKHYVCFNDHRPKTYWTENFGDIRILKDGVLPVKIDIIPMKSIENSEESINFDRSLVNLATFFKKGKFKNSDHLLPSHKHYLPKNNSEFLNKKKEFYKFFIEEFLHNNCSIKKEHLYNYAFNDVMVKHEREYYRYDEIFPLKEIQFENQSFSCPNNVDSYLTTLYGKNYIIPPEEKDRIPYAYDNYWNDLDKAIIEPRLKLHNVREFELGIARSSKLYVMRLANKMATFISLSVKSIKNRDVGYIFVYLRYSLRDFTH